jgi:hypothetical protein
MVIFWGAKRNSCMHDILQFNLSFTMWITYINTSLSAFVSARWGLAPPALSSRDVRERCYLMLASSWSNICWYHIFLWVRHSLHFHRRNRSFQDVCLLFTTVLSHDMTTLWAVCPLLFQTTAWCLLQDTVINFFLICIVGGGVQTGSTRHVGHLLAYCTSPGDREDGEFGGMNGRGNRSTRRKSAPTPLCPPQIPLD